MVDGGCMVVERTYMRVAIPAKTSDEYLILSEDVVIFSNKIPR